MKQNDWIIANINNPDFTSADLKYIGGLSLDNTQLLSFDDYLKNDKVINNPLFKDDSGNFNKDKFKTYYDEQAIKFKNFYEDSSADNYQYGFWDIFQKNDSNVKNPNFKIEKESNPTHTSKGVIGINQPGIRYKSDRELAEKQKIYNWTKNTFEEDSPEDMALFSNPIKFISNLLSEPLVLAKYEEDIDEIDPLTGKMVHHTAGEKKTNSEGEYYYETLGGRSLVGKEVLSIGDILTKEDSYVNKYDFFDSDDLEKSTAGIITKNLAAIAPMALLGPWGTAIYSSLYISRELTKTLPMLNSFSQMFSEESGDNEWLNTLAAYGEKFTGSTSDYSKTKTFVFENFGNLISDVALQWGQQTAIAKGVNKLLSGNKELLDIAKAKGLSEYTKQASNLINRTEQGFEDMIRTARLTGATSIGEMNDLVKSGKWAETIFGQKAIEKNMNSIRDIFVKRQRLGQDLSLVYMALISNTDVYQSALEHGTTKQEAAMVSLGSTVGMFLVDKYLGLGEMFFDDELAKQKRLYRKLLKEHYDKDVAPVINNLAQSPKAETKEGLLNFFKVGKQKTMEFLKDYHSDIKDRSLSILGKSIGEGLEEATEELITDISKTLYEVAGKYGYVSQTDIGAWDNMAERYLMSLFGGAIGGGIFGVQNAIKNPKSASDINSQEHLLLLVRQGETGNILKELERMRNEGKLGSKELSIDSSKTTNSDGSEGESVFLSADSNHISQNDFVYNQMKTAIQQMDEIINGNQLNISDDKLFERMVMSDQKLTALKEYLKDSSYISGYFNDFQTLVKDFYNNEVEIEKLQKTSDQEKRNSVEYQNKLDELLKKREELKQRKEDFFTNKSQYYLYKTLFLTNPLISGMFVPSSLEQYTQLKLGKWFEDLSESEKESIKLKYDEYLKGQKKIDADEAFDAFMEMTKKINPSLQELNSDDIQSWRELRKKIAENFPKFNQINEDDRVESQVLDIDETLTRLGITRSEEYDRPWKTDPSKVNKAFMLQLTENPSLYFEIIKDLEDGFWSIHFKTANPDPNGNPVILTNEQKERLFNAAAIVIPEGDKLSTWGELTKGGVSGINRFQNLGFVKVGERDVKLKQKVRDIVSENDKYTTTIPELDDNFDYYVAESDPINADNFFENGVNIPVRKINNNEELQEYSQNISKGGFVLLKIEKGKDINEITESGVISKDNIENFVEITPVYQSTLEDIKIPIWQKNTGESPEDYENRNTPLEGETEEEFKARKEARRRRLYEQYEQKMIQQLDNMLNNVSMIDSNTFRYIMGMLRIRKKDLIRRSAVDIVRVIENSGLQTEIFNILSLLNDDLSNQEDILKQVESKIIEYINSEYSSFIFDEDSNVKSNENEEITFNNVLDALLEAYPEELINSETDLEEYTKTVRPLSGSIYKNIITDLFNLNMVLAHPDLLSELTLQSNYVDGETVYQDQLSTIEEVQKLKSLLENKLLDFKGYTKSFIDTQYKNNVDPVKEQFNKILEGLKKSKAYSVIDKLKNKLRIDNNPTLKIIKLIADKVGENFSDIETTLQSIYEQYNTVGEIGEFQLSDPQIQTLETFQKLITIANSVINAASGEDNYVTPWNFNKTINEWNHAHKSELTTDIEDLPELDVDVANVVLQSLARYDTEINMWIQKAKSNGINKIKMFKEFDQTFEEVKLKFFMDNKYKDKEGNLLLENVPSKSNPKDQVLEYERALYNKIKELRNKGYTDQDIFNIFSSSINWDLAKEQITSRLDNNLKVLTEYDKFVYILTIIGENPDNFYLKYKKFVESNSKIAPLSFQKHAIRVLSSQMNSKEFFNKMLDFFQTKAGIADLVTLHNTAIITGIGGSGKTNVVAKFFIDDNTWVCGPTETQVTNLQKLGNNLKGLEAKELLKFILQGQYSSFYNDLQNKKTVILDWKTNTKGGKVDTSKVKVIKQDKVPKTIVIDEATLISNAELQVISKWAELNGVFVILAGDENQNGDRTNGNNIARENTLAIRVPKLQLSLREANLWKYQNQQELMSLEDSLRDTTTKEETEVVANRIIGSLNSFGLKYFFKDGILTGDMIVETLTEEQINSLNGSVKYIGSESSENYQKLKSAEKITKAESIESIQGQEADYVVCDIDWTHKDFSDPFELLAFLQKLYTVITRSKQGTIIINNGLNNTISGSTPQSYTTPSVILNEEAIKQFIQSEIEWLNSLNLNPTEDKDEEKTPFKPLNGEVIEPKLPDEKIKGKNDDIPENLPVTSDLPIQVYSNFNFLGIDMDSEGKYINPENLHNDLGIFISSEDIIDDSKKHDLWGLLLDLKSYFLYEDLEEFDRTAKPELTDILSGEELKKAKYYIVKNVVTKENKNKFHLGTYEQGLKDPEVGEVIYTLVAKFKNDDGEECSLTLGVLPKHDNLHEKIIQDQIKYNLNQLEKDSADYKEQSKLLSDVESGKATEDYRKGLEKIDSEIEIEKPVFTQFTGLSKIRDVGENGETSYFRLRLQEVNSEQSRYSTRAEAYVISPVYASMAKGDPDAGKPFILVTGNRRHQPSQLLNLYLEQKQHPDEIKPQIRKIFLDSAGVSFESLFDSRYSDTFVTTTSNEKKYSFPFNLLPTGIRMYTALHNFRVYLTQFNDKVKEKFGDNLNDLENLLKEESRLYQKWFDIKDKSKKPFKEWLNDNQDEISGYSLDDIKKIWDFNEKDLKGIKQFRLGYNSKHGVYVRNISDNYPGNYINPTTAKLYLGTIQKIFTEIIDKIIPPESVNMNDIVDYRVSQDEFERIQDNWVKHLEKSGELVLKINDDPDNIVTIKVQSRERLKAIPLVLTLLAKNLQARQRMGGDPDNFFEDYMSEDSPYNININGDSVEYLKILEGGLTEIGGQQNPSPGVLLMDDNTLKDVRLLDMFNVAFHGTVATGENDFIKNIHPEHAIDVLFPYGFFVDPIRGGQYTEYGDYRIISTSIKYFKTNLSPSGAKTFILLKPKNVSEEHSEEKGNEEDNFIFKQISYILGDDFYQGEDYSTDNLLKEANKTIKFNLKNDLSLASNFTLDELLNLPIEISLQNGIIKTIYVKDFEELKNISNIVGINHKEDGSYDIIMNNGIVYNISYDGRKGVNIKSNGAAPISNDENNTIEYVISGFLEVLNEQDEELAEKIKKSFSKNDSQLKRTEQQYDKVIQQLISNINNFVDADFDYDYILKQIKISSESYKNSCTIS